MTSPLTTDRVRAALYGVPDPEIPTVSVVDLGIVQHIDVSQTAAGADVVIDITPTFTGCPALEMMRAEIGEAVMALGAHHVEVRVVLDPPWSSDRLTPAAREAMRAIGLAPPPPASRFKADPMLGLSVSPLGDLTGDTDDPVVCPFCASTNTVTDNPFGSTLCRSVHYCQACQQPFEAFKPL